MSAETKTAVSEPQLNDAEKKFLKQHYDSEFKFLMTHGLKMHDDQDRAEGRRILRSFMAADDDDGESAGSNQFFADMEADPASHVADYHFSEAQLNWIQKHYLHSGDFMRSHGLKPFDDEDCEEAVQIVEIMMDDEEDDGDADSVESNQFLADLEADPTSHVADYQFSETQLDWIEKHYRHSGQFMLSYGLKPFDDEDCKEAVEMLKTLMR